MTQLFQQVIYLITNSPGNLAYHLIISFTIIGAFVGGINQRRLNPSPQATRLIIGLVILLVIRLFLFGISGLTLVGILEQQGLLSPTERIATSLAITVIVWMWVFPEKVQIEDLATVLIGLLSSLGGVVTILSLLSGHNPGLNGQLLDQIWNGYSIILILIGFGLLLTRRPADWQFGIVMLAGLFVGHIFTIWVPDVTSDASGAVRLGQLISYPFLFALPQRLVLPARDESGGPIRSLTPVRARYDARPETLDAFISLAIENDINNLPKAITIAVAHAMLSDICCYLSMADEAGDVVVQSAYDLVHETEIGGGLLRKKSIPLIIGAMEKGRALRLPSSSSSSDLKALTNLLSVEENGHLLLAPIKSGDRVSFGGIVLYSPYSKRNWGDEEQSYLLKIGEKLARIILDVQNKSGIDTGEAGLLNKIKQELEFTKAELSQVEQDNLALLEEVLSLREEVNKPTLDDGVAMAPLLAAQERAIEQIAQLENENQELRTALEGVSERSELNLTTVDGIINFLRDAIDDPDLIAKYDKGRIGVLNAALLNAGIYGESMPEEDRDIDQLRTMIRARNVTGELSLDDIDKDSRSDKPVILKPGELKIIEDRMADLELENELFRKSAAENDLNIKETVDEMAALKDAHQETLDLIRNLKDENQQLKTTLKAYSNDIQKGGSALQPISEVVPEIIDIENEKIEIELRASLKEVARLQRVIGELEVKMFQLERQAQNTNLATKRWSTIINLAQELRQPMSSIVGYTDFLLGESVGILGSLQRKFLDRVKTSTERMNTMIEDLLQIATMESGQLQLEIGVVIFADVIDEALSKTSAYFRDKNIALRMDFPGDMPIIQGDKEALLQVLIHILQNAGDVSPVDGQIALKAENESYDDGQKYVLLSIQDSGPGISAEDIHHVFDYTPDQVQKQIPGVGNSLIGLSISKTLVEAHGGRIWIDTETDVGAKFSILLPLKRTFPDVVQET